MRAALAEILVVTGTDTDVGKTIVTATLAAAGILAGRDVVCIKPCQTGLRASERGDVQQAAWLAGLPGDRALEYVRLPEPLAPTTAARRAKMVVPAAAEIGARVLADARDLTLVEGAGGVLVGLDNDGGTLLDVAEAVAASGARPRFVVVARAGLGTLNHTALTCDAVRARGFDVAGVVVGAMPRTPGLAERCNLEEVAAAAHAPLWGCLPAGIGEDPGAVRAAADGFRRVLAR